MNTSEKNQPLKIKKSYFILPIILVLAGLIYSLVLRKSETVLSDNSLRIGVTQWIGFSAAQYAQSSGLYKNAGLKIEIIRAQNNEDLFYKYENGEVDAVATNLFALALHKSRGDSLRLVLPSDYSNRDHALFSKNPIQNIQDLQNKKIGIDATGSAAHFAVVQLLKHAGLSEDQVTFEPVPENEIIEALNNNIVDAAFTSGKNTDDATAKGFHIITKGGDVPGLILSGYAFAEEDLSDKKELVKSFVAATLEAQTQCSADPRKCGLNSRDEAIVFFNPESTRKAYRINEDFGSISFLAKQISEFLFSRGQSQDQNLQDELYDIRFSH